MVKATKVSMTEVQFDMAMSNLTMSADNRRVARQFLVEGRPTKALRDEGVSASRLSKVIKRSFENFERQTALLGLVNGQYTLDRQTAALVREIEACKISEAKLKAAALKKRRRAPQRVLL